MPSRSTGERPADRLVLERPFLTPLPRVRFDTDYVETRRVHNIVSFISVERGRYGLPANILGQLVEIRRPVDSDQFSVRHAGRVIAVHTLDPDPGPDIIWLPEHRAANEAAAINRRHPATRRTTRHLRLIAPATPSSSERLELGDGDYDIDTPDLEQRYGIDITDDITDDVDLEDLA